MYTYLHKDLDYYYRELLLLYSLHAPPYTHTVSVTVTMSETVTQTVTQTVTVTNVPEAQLNAQEAKAPGKFLPGLG